MATRRVWHRLYWAQRRGLPMPNDEASLRRPWIAECLGCFWMHSEPTWVKAYGFARTHACPRPAGFR